ncbi:MAG TPA: porin [Acidobacteriota bacterium]|nr:porin [Acidobacteriota bacterium]
MSLVLPPGWAKALKPGGTDVRLDSGVVIELRRSDIRLQAGGRLQYDLNLASSDSVDDDHRLRRLYATLRGRHRRLFFKAEWNFAGRQTDIVDLYAGLDKLPWIGRLRFGHLKEPIGLERLTSNTDSLFVERSLGATVFMDSRNLGLVMDNTALQGRLFWSGGIFREASGVEAGEGALNYTARVSLIPWRQGNSRLLQLGFSGSRRKYVDSRLRFAESAESVFSQRLLDTGELRASSGRVLQPELSFKWGAFSVQSEWTRSSIRWTPETSGPLPAPARWVDFHSGYLQFAWALNQGGHRPFDFRRARYTRMRGFEPVHRGGAGGWEVAARWSMIDLDEGDIRGGRMRSATLGVNWYPSRFSRLTVNYIHSRPHQAETIHRLQARLQLAF